eukprot:g7209.t1
MVNEIVGALEELVEQQTALERRKAELREQKDGQYRQKYAALQRRMKELDQSALEHRKARHAALRRMAELQEGEETFAIRRLEYEKEKWEVERGLQLEKLARQAMEVQPIEEQRKELENEQRLRLLRLDAIEEEKLRRQREKERQLKDSLDRAKHLQEHAGGGRSDPVASALEADKDYEDPEERGSAATPGYGLAKMAAEIDVVRRRAARESVRAHEALRRKLNEQRVRLAGETDSIQLKMQQIRAEHAGGLTALARGELGPAAFQILATPVPPGVISAWASKASRKSAGESSPSTSKRPGRKRRGSSNISETTSTEGEEIEEEEERGQRDDDDGGSTNFHDGGRKATDGPAGEAKDNNNDESNDDDEQQEATEDMIRSQAIASFLQGSATTTRGAVGLATASGGARRNAFKRRGAQVLASPSPSSSESGGDTDDSSSTPRERPSRKQDKNAPARARIDKTRSDSGGGGHDRDSRRQMRRSRLSSAGGDREGDESGGTEEDESGEDERREESVALDVEQLVVDLREREGEVLSRIEALRSQADALAKEEDWLATGSLGKGHAWEGVSRLWSDGEKRVTGGGIDPHGDDRLEADRINLEVANRVMAEEARVAKREADLLSAASTILEEHVSEEVRNVFAELMAASDVALEVVGAALASSAAAAAARSRLHGGGGGGGGGGDSTVSAPAPTKDRAAWSRLQRGPVEELLFSSFRELLRTDGTEKAAGGEGDAGGGRGMRHAAAAATVSNPVVLRLKDVQPYRPLRNKELPACERFYIDKVSAERYYVAVPKGDGLVTAIAMGPAAVTAAVAPAAATMGAPAGAGAGAGVTASASGGTFLLAAGTNKGGIAVWAMPCREEEDGASGGSKKSKYGGRPSGGVLVRVASAAALPKQDRCPVTRVHFGADGRSQLVSLDSQRTVKVWDIGGGREANAALQEHSARGGGGKGGAAGGAGGAGAKAAARDFLPELRGTGGGVSTKFQAVPLVPRCTIRRNDLTRPVLDPGITSWLEGSSAAAAGLNPKHKNEGNASNKKNGVKGRGREQDAGTASASTLPSVGGGSWPVSTKRNTDATAVTFHTAMTAFGDQPSVVIATAGGSLVKCNSDAWMAAGSANGDGGDVGTAGAAVVYGRCAVSLEPGERGAAHESTVLRNVPRVEEEDEEKEEEKEEEEEEEEEKVERDRGKGEKTGGGGNHVRREFFERHRHPVLFVGFQDHMSLTMVTLDTSGLMCVWPYSADAFSGFGWYTPSKEVLVDVTLHTYKLETKPKPNRAAGKAGRGAVGGDQPAYIFNRALPPASSETTDPQEALAELRAGGYRLWSTMPAPARGRSETYLAALDGRGSSRDARESLPAIVARYDEEGELKSASRFRASEGAREGAITDAKLTVSGGELAVVAAYRPQAGGSGAAAGGRASGGAASSSKGGGDGNKSEGGAAPQATVMVFLVDLQSLRLLPQHVRHDWMTAESNSFPSPAFAVSPVLDGTGSDYVYLTVGDSIRVFSFETGLEVMLHGGRRLSTNTRGDIDAARGGNATPAAIAAAATAPIVAVEVSTDNETLAVACADSGAVTLFQLSDNSLQSVAQHRQDKLTAPSAGNGGVGGTDDLAWRKILRGFTCDRRDATPWEMRVHLTTPFAPGQFEGFDHRSQIRHFIVGEMIVETALAVCEKNRTAKKLLLEPIEGGEAANGRAPGRVSLRDLLGKPPYGTV